MYLSTETTTDSNSHRAEPVSGNTDRAEVNSKNEPTSKHKQKRNKSRKRKRSPTPSPDSESRSESDNSEDEKETIDAQQKVSDKEEESKWSLPDEKAAYANRLFEEYILHLDIEKKLLHKHQYLPIWIK